MNILSHVAVLRWWNLSFLLLNVAGSSCDAVKVKPSSSKQSEGQHVGGSSDFSSSSCHTQMGNVVGTQTSRLLYW